jgi:hypothetical protein
MRSSTVSAINPSTYTGALGAWGQQEQEHEQSPTCSPQNVWYEYLFVPLDIGELLTCELERAEAKADEILVGDLPKL